VDIDSTDLGPDEVVPPVLALLRVDGAVGT
jgi:hypothetical protein